MSTEVLDAQWVYLIVFAIFTNEPLLTKTTDNSKL